MPLSTIIGHGAVRAVLRQAVARDRVPQSLLLAGPEGVGKHAVALALAQAVNCPVRRSSGGDDACGSCPTCQRIARGSHSDVVSLDRGEDAVIKIKTLRERVLDVVGYRPFEAARRVFIIAADDLRGEAQDALLKTLEEPPSSTILILVAAYPDALLPTVLSRCRRLRFAPLSEDDVARVLVERVKIEPAQARLLAASSGGSVSRALAERSGDLSDDRDAAMTVLASAGRGVAAQLSASTTLAKHESDRRDREALTARLDVLRSLLRDLAVLAARGGSPLANADLERELRAASATFDLPRLARAYGTIARAESALDRNAGPKIVADWIATRL
jgi:DNA polymerase-3 subunit delta'